MTAAQAQVVSALEAMGHSPLVLNRLALASTMGKGEAVWVFELAFQLAGQGVDARREQTVGRVHRVDLAVLGEAFEVKSSFVRFAARSTEQETDRWFDKDVAKLRKGTAPGHQLITLATMLKGEHHQKTFDVGPPKDVSAVEPERGKAIQEYKAYAERVGAGPVQHVALGQGEVPGGRVSFSFDALLFSVHLG
jgi:hypothetical protein